ncbi:YhcN/YlaJ family sporulation lipoprotein [Fictibacillus sp. Mic-4]|uniref:YhcN/YlaJ family sporulation lipoprotein n=1 Tax=Fictibacillus TaxID=1329200 RepID=UPI000409C2EA|nr:YhcN/YlaJ family sporulation lipoprotein [Fictibacillus gelatini]
MKIKIILSLAAVLLLSACGGYDWRNDRATEYKFSRVNYKEANQRNRNYADFGFERHERKGEHARALKQHEIPYIDRQKLAHTVTDLAIRMPQIKDAATLVTDKEVLIAYVTTNKDRMAAADMVKDTAMSIVPRYYHVYVSDEKGMIPKLQQYQSFNTHTANRRVVINHLIKEMKRSPQGYPVGTENANGEKPGEMEMEKSRAK